MAIQNSVFILAAFLLPRYGWSQSARQQFESPHMGTVVRIVAYGEKAKVEPAVKAALARIAALEEIFSDYKPTSEIMKLCKANDAKPGEWHRASPELLEVVSIANSLSERSEGAFDVTVGPLTQLWRQTRRTQQLPDADELKQALDKVGYRNIALDAATKKIRLAKPAMRLDFGGIVKGYAADEAMKILIKAGFPESMIAVSGDILCGDAPPGEKGWKVEIAPLVKGMAPRTLILKNAAVSTSGDLFQYVEIKGVRYSHLLNPKTGLGLTGRRSVTVIAPRGIDADSLTKAASILPPADAIKLINEIPYAATLIAVKDKDESEIVITQSERMANYLPEPKPSPAKKTEPPNDSD